MKLKKTRIIIQGLFLLIFCILFFGFNLFRFDGTHSALAWFLRLNPLPMIVTSIAARSIVLSYVIIGLVMIIITLIFGRIFCGMLCPLGTIIDISDRFVHGKKRKPQNRPSVKLQKLKYFLLFGVLVAAMAGITFPLFMDPLLLMSRFFTVLVRPALVFIVSPLLEIVKVDPELVFSESALLSAGFKGAIATFLLLSVIIGASFIDKRFWCQYVCPSGAFFGLLSKFSLLTRHVNSDKCNQCGVCNRNRCPTRAIVEKDVTKTIQAECILCGECSSDQRHCSSFSFGVPAKNAIQMPDIGRREALGGIAAGALLVPVIMTSGKTWGAQRATPIRPPGAVDESSFLAKCITCAACVSVCPNHALQLSTISDDGFSNWNTPKLVARVGYCLPECTRCTEACPSGALIPLTAEQKSKSRIGAAVVNRNRCRPWQGQFQCMICMQKCPYGAIEEKIIIEGDVQWKVPVVNIRKCTGCGSCEFHCPVMHESAIQVFSPGERRIKIGRK